MRKSRFTEEQKVAAVKEAEAGANVRELCRRLGMSRETLYAWKRKYGGMEVSDAKRLKQLEDENRQLKRIVADQALNLQALKDVLGNKL
jgi:putative transposase